MSRVVGDSDLPDLRRTRRAAKNARNRPRALVKAAMTAFRERRCVPLSMRNGVKNSTVGVGSNPWRTYIGDFLQAT